jgi:IclR family acetate operon transcriptional repressor
LRTWEGALAGEDLRTVDRTLQLLELIGRESDRELTLADLCRATGFAKTTTLRMLSTLANRGYVARERATGRYSIGPAALVMAGAFRNRLRKTARAILSELVAATGETALMHVLDGDMSLCIAKVDSPHPSRVTYDVGRRGPLHAGSSGKVLLAFLDVAERDAILRRIPLDRYTEVTTTDLAVLRRELAAIRERGYVQTFGELDANVYGVGAPVWDATGHLAAGVTLVGPAHRWTDERRAGLVTETLAAARMASAELGRRGGGEEAQPSVIANHPGVPA